jgi:hypothetical protein
MLNVRSEERITLASNNSEKSIIWFLIEEELKGRKW